MFQSNKKWNSQLFRLKVTIYEIHNYVYVTSIYMYNVQKNRIIETVNDIVDWESGHVQFKDVLCTFKTNKIII